MKGSAAPAASSMKAARCSSGTVLRELDLSSAAINEQFDAGDKTGVV
jgi:hypothetical protein